MRRRILIVGNCVVLVMLLAVISAELFHLATDHFLRPKGLRAYQQALLAGIRESVCLADSSMSGEELIRNFNAEHIRHMYKEDVLRLPKHKQGRYMEKELSSGAWVPLDWDFYEIDPIGDYRGVLEIGTSDGVFKNGLLEYTFCEGD